MSCSCRFLICFLFVATLSGCHGGGRVSQDYRYEQDCLNGYSIVGDGELFGVKNSRNGELVIPVEWRKVLFLTDAVLAVRNAGEWLFMDLDANVLGRSSAEAGLARDILYSEYCAQVRMSENLWEKVVLDYERFCRMCIGADMLPGDVKSLAESLKREAGGIPGYMSEAQRKRIERAYDDFKRGRP